MVFAVPTSDRLGDLGTCLDRFRVQFQPESADNLQYRVKPWSTFAGKGFIKAFAGKTSLTRHL